MLPNLYKTLASAIRNKRRVVIRYNGRSRSRVVEPHILFKSEDGGIGLLGYQIRGYHSRKRNQGSFWRAFQLRKIDGIHVTSELFTARESQGYSAVANSLKGEVLASLAVDTNGYEYFDERVQGPPVPAYLAPTPTLMLRMARDTGAQGSA